MQLPIEDAAYSADHIELQQTMFHILAPLYITLQKCRRFTLLVDLQHTYN